MPYRNITTIVTPTIGTSLQTILSVPPDREFITDEIRVIVMLKSITELPSYVEDPLLSDDAKARVFWEAITAGQSKRMVLWQLIPGIANSQFQRINDFLIVRRDPGYPENVMARYTGLLSWPLQAGVQLAISIENSNTGILSGSDQLTFLVNGQVS